MAQHNKQWSSQHVAGEAPDTRANRMMVSNHTSQDGAAFTEAEYRAHMEARKESLAELGEIFLEDSMVRCLNPSVHIMCQKHRKRHRDITIIH